MDHQGDGDGDELRRSSRPNKGQPPSMYGEWDMGDRLSKEKDTGSSKPEFPVTSTPKDSVSDRKVSRPQSVSSNLSNVLLIRKKEAELAAAKELALLEEEEDRRTAQRKRSLINLNLELEKMKIGTEDDSDQQTESDRESTTGSLPTWIDDQNELLGLGDRLKRLKTFPHDHEISQKEISAKIPPSLVTSGSPVDQLAQALVQAIGKVTGPSQTVSTSTTSDTNKFLARQSHAKDLPFFYGKSEEWLPFISAYDRTTRICGFSKDENLMRLQRCLKGDAAAAVQCLMITPDNIEKIIKTLKIRFGQTKHIIEALILKAKNIPSVREDKLDTLISFGTAVVNLTSTMKALKSQNHLRNPQLLSELIAKLPVNLKMQWVSKLESKYSGDETVENFSDWLEKKTEQACRLVPPKVTEEKTVKDNRRKETVLGTSENTDQVKRTRFSVTHECLFCHKKGHILSACRSFQRESSEAKWNKVKELKVCFICLKIGHRSSNCSEHKPCGRDDCQRFHHPALHEEKSKSLKQPQKLVGAKSEEELNPVRGDLVTNTNIVQSGPNRKLLRIIQVKLRGPKGEVSTYAILDEGSTITMLKSDIAKEIGLIGKTEALCIQWVDGHPRNEENSERVQLEVTGDFKDSHFYKLNDVRTISDLHIPAQSIDVDHMKRKWTHLKNLKMKSMDKVTPTILIGIDNAKLTAHRQILEGPGNSPIATRTKLGWALGGVCNSSSNGKEFAFHVCEVESDENLHQMMKDYFTTESFGVKICEEKPRSKQDIRALKILEVETKKLENIWETALLWKNDEIVLPESKINALHRLKCIEKKMDRSHEFSKVYCDKIHEYLDKGFIRKLTASESAVVGPRTWYLPHFGVTNPNKPGKLRLVFDAAAKSKGISLNDVLLTGPDLLNSLQAILWKFRQKRIAFTADIKDMFHRIRIRREDHGSQRFLWRGTDRSRTPNTYEMQVMIFGATSSPSSALYVKNRNAMENQDEFPKASQAIVDHFYMDDYGGNADEIEEAKMLVQNVIAVNQRGGFNICNWVCNDQSVLDVIPEELRVHKVKTFNNKTDVQVERMLGLGWDAAADEFVFKVNFYKVPKAILECEKRPTKRQMASLVMSIFDPLGFVAPFKIKGLILLQEAWRSEITWDDKIPDNLNKIWTVWVNELFQIENVRIPRNYSSEFSKSEDIQLHVFCDASEEAFTAVSYLRIKEKNGIKIAFANGKVRVAPIKQLTVPRLELQAAVMATRLATSLTRELERPIQRTVYWTDSKTVLSWIRSITGRFKQFIAFRVGEILETSDVLDWKWIPTKMNPADDATRSAKTCDFSKESRWLNGPEFLYMDEPDWPKEVRNDTTNYNEEVECVNFIRQVNDRESDLPDITHFSSWIKLVRATAMVRKAAQSWRKKVQKVKVSTQLTVNELKEAEILWLRRVQFELFPSEVTNLTNRKPLERNSRLQLLSPFLDEDGVIKIKGRIDSVCGVPYEAKRPVILDPNHKFTQLLIQHHHMEGGHQGFERVVNDLRQKYWIIGIRGAVKKAWKSCQDCQNRKVKPVIPEMGSLPRSRLKHGQLPFSGTGVDYFGPMQVTIGRRREKRWGVLFSCMVSRAIHLELAPSLDTDQMIQALMRFINRRGRPDHIYSDNGTNFKGADVEIRKALEDFNQERISDHLVSKGIEWHFIPPSAPHMGGSWERLVQIVKKTLGRLLKEQSPKEYTLLTLFTEVENIVNSRPLTYVSTNPEDPESLTPNHFLRLKSLSGPSIPGYYEKSDKCFGKQWRMAQGLADHFWGRWIREYLPTLTRRAKWQDPSNPLKVNDVVIVMNDQLPRNNWQKGIITAVFPGKDGQVRVVEVKTETGVYRRPVTKICPLDVRSRDNGDTLSGGRMSSSEVK